MVGLIGMIGGDLRQKHMATVLSKPIMFYGNDSITEHGNITKSTSLCDLMEHCNVLILPIPFSKDQTSVYARYFIETIPINFFLEGITKEHLVLGGPFTESIKRSIQKKGASLIDLTKLETFKMQNAIPTVEGIIAELILRMDITIHQSLGLIVGFGYCGKRAVDMLSSLGARIEVYTESDLEQKNCQLKGVPCKGVIENLASYDFVINTIPKDIVDTEQIKKAKLFIDITDAYSEGVEQFIQMRGIPGRYSPKTAGGSIGALINEVINNVIGEDG